MERNLILIRLIYGFRYFVIYMPILVIFMEAHKLSFTDFFVTQATFALIYALFNLPGGYFSDKIGWKNSMILASLINLAAIGLYAFWYSLTSFIIAEALFGFAFVLFNGSEIAMLYESLTLMKRTKEYKQQQGTCEMWGRIAEGIACIIGGFVAADSINLPFQIQFGISFILIGCVFALKNIKHHTPASQPTLKQTITLVFFNKPPLRWIIFYSSIIGFTTLTAVWLMQPYFKDLHISLIWFGFGWAIMNFVVGISAQLEPSVEKKIGLKPLLLAIPIVIAIGLLCFGAFDAAALYIVLLIISVMRGFKIPLVMNIINSHVTSNIRATAVNSESFITRILFAIIAPWIGYLSDSQIGMSHAFYVLMALCGLVAIISLLHARKLQFD